MKRYTNICLFSLLIAIALLSSCSFSSYVPVTVYEPLLTQKGEKQGVAYLGANHIELQGACALSDHLGIQGDIWKDTHKRYSIELLPGYYNHSDGYCFSFYAGTGIANTSGVNEITYQAPFGNTREKKVNEVRYTSLILQPGIGYRLKYFEIGFATRFSYVTFSQYDVKNYKWYSDDDKDPDITNSYRSKGFGMWVYQPSINISAGLENIKAFFSASFNIPSDLKGEKSGYYHPYFQTYLFASGIKVSIHGSTKFRRNPRIVF